MLAILQRLDELLEFLLRSKQTGTQKIEQRPQVTQPVFDGSAGQRNPGFGFKLFDGFVCRAAGFLIA